MVRFGRAQKASALLPLAVLSAAWTASLATSGSDASAAASSGTLPDGTRVPARAVQAPASLTPSRDLTSGVRGGTRQVVATASASGIPAVALAAYQRAAEVIDTADRTCHMPWQLVAAIGRVESDHGRVDGNALTAKGVAEPGIFGPVLDGRNGTARIPDTDGGRYDGNTTWDRAVGPMQFIPSTWAIVGVDADNDGRRNPQDINDAALASAVYLCSGTDDLATLAGQRAAVFRYNHSQQYVDLVLGIERAYASGDYTSVPNGTTTTSYTLGNVPLAPGTTRRHHHPTGHHHRERHHSTTGSGPVATASATPSSGPTATPSHAPTGAPTTLPTALPTTLPTTLLTTLPSPLPTVLSTAQAIVQCLADGLIEGTKAFDACVAKLTGG